MFDTLCLAKFQASVQMFFEVTILFRFYYVFAAVTQEEYSNKSRERDQLVASIFLNYPG